MLGYRQAEELAATWVRLATDGRGVLQDEQTVDKPYGWVFFYQSREWIESPKTEDGLIGNAPIIVDRINGEIRVTGTAQPIEEYIAAYEASIPPAQLRMTPEKRPSDAKRPLILSNTKRYVGSVRDSTSVAWMVDLRLASVSRRDFDWVFEFDSKSLLTVAYLWRLLQDGRIRRTSEDHGQQFGLPAPVDAAADLNQRIAGKTITAAELQEGTLDLRLQFDRTHVLEIIPNSSGYEAWKLDYVKERRTQYFADGGGRLAISENLPASFQSEAEGDANLESKKP
jgi:Immunity protein 35